MVKQHSSIYISMYFVYSVHNLMDIHSYFLAVMNDTAMNTYMFLCGHMFSFLEYITRGRVDASYSNSGVN